MLNTITDFPNVGSEAVIVRTGELARILQRNQDGTVLVAVRDAPPSKYAALALARASGNRRVILSDLRSAAEPAPLPTKRRRKAKGKA